MLTAPPMKLVLVDWVDSHEARGWRSMDKLLEIAHPLPCQSVGWLLSRADGCAVIVPHVAGDGVHLMRQGCGALTIPTCAIKKVRRLSC